MWPLAIRRRGPADGVGSEGRAGHFRAASARRRSIGSMRACSPHAGHRSERVRATVVEPSCSPVTPLSVLRGRSHQAAADDPDGFARCRAGLRRRVRGHVVCGGCRTSLRPRRPGSRGRAVILRTARVTTSSAPRLRCRWTGTARTARRSSWPSSATWPVAPRSGSGRCSSTRAVRVTAASRSCRPRAPTSTPGVGAASTSSVGIPAAPTAARRWTASPAPQPGTGSGRV